jgi:hypothetical protein
MNEQFANIVTGLAAALAVTYLGLEISRRRRQLREVYDVLGTDDRQICIALEQMVEDGMLKPWRPGDGV